MATPSRSRKKVKRTVVDGIAHIAHLSLHRLLLKKRVKLLWTWV